jgi:hypothetical protein
MKWSTLFIFGFALVLGFEIVSAIDTVFPWINFTSPTPANGSCSVK